VAAGKAPDKEQMKRNLAYKVTGSTYHPDKVTIGGYWYHKGEKVRREDDGTR